MGLPWLPSRLGRNPPGRPVASLQKGMSWAGPPGFAVAGLLLGCLVGVVGSEKNICLR